MKKIVSQALDKNGITDISVIENRDEGGQSFEKVLKSNYWYSENVTLFRKERVALRRALVTALLQNKPLIIWHFDGDKSFSDFSTESCVAKSRYTDIMSGIEDSIKGRNGQWKKLHKNNIVLMIPCYSIEAWLFQNKSFYADIIDELKRQLPYLPNEETKQSIEKQIYNLEELNELTPEKFDELVKIKELFPRDKAGVYYPLMAENLPYETLLSLNKSYQLFISELRKGIGE